MGGGSEISPCNDMGCYYDQKLKPANQICTPSYASSAGEFTFLWKFKFYILNIFLYYRACKGVVFWPILMFYSIAWLILYQMY